MFDEVHEADEVMFFVEPSLNVAVAVNCRVAPTATDGSDGVTEIEVRTVPPPVALLEPQATSALKLTSKKATTKKDFASFAKEAWWYARSFEAARTGNPHCHEPISEALGARAQKPTSPAASSSLVQL